jgi:protein phosphatase PTC2/3
MNDALGPQDQMITANPDVTCHEIMEDDEFLVLACDGDLGSPLIARPLHIF